MDDYGNGQVYVPFGGGDADKLSLEHASRVLRLLRDREPELLAALVGEALTGAYPKGRPRSGGSRGRANG